MAMANIETLDSLRRQLREKFPRAHASAVVLGAAAEAENAVETAKTDLAGKAVGFGEEAGERPRLLAAGSFPVGAISEVVSEGPVSGLGLWVAEMLAESAEGPTAKMSDSPQLVWIDGADGFDPASFDAAACSRLLWVRCRAVAEMFRAADLLARDGNAPFLLIDATGLPRRELSAFPASAWWRLKQAVEGNGTRLVVLSSAAMVPCAARRWQLSADFSLEDFDRPAADLLGRLEVVTERLRRVN